MVHQAERQPEGTSRCARHVAESQERLVRTQPDLHALRVFANQVRPHLTLSVVATSTRANLLTDEHRGVADAIDAPRADPIGSSVLRIRTRGPDDDGRDVPSRTIGTIGGLIWASRDEVRRDALEAMLQVQLAAVAVVGGQPAP